MYEPVMLNSLLNVGTGHKLRTQQYRFFEDMLKNGLPFVIPLVDVCHFKLPSQGPHKAVHFVWKKRRGDEDDDPQQTKLVCQLRKKTYIYYSRSLKREIWQQLLKLGIVKPCQSTFAIKNLLGDTSAAENEGQRELLERLNIAVALGEEIIVDLRCNSDR